MACEPIKALIPDFPELDCATQEHVRAHAARCAGCQELLNASIDLDQQLSMRIKAPEQFERKVLARIERRPSYLPEFTHTPCSLYQSAQASVE